MQPAQSSEERTGGTLDLLLAMEIPLAIRFGHTKMLLGDLAGLTAGSTVEFPNSPDRHVDLVVNGRVVARGNAVLVNGNYGIKISEVLEVKRAGAGPAPGRREPLGNTD
jgi:flagellar motor switch protein FliN